MSKRCAGPTHTLSEEWLEICFEVQPLRRPDGSVCGISKVWTGREEVDVEKDDLEDTLIPLIEEAYDEACEAYLSQLNARREMAGKPPLEMQELPQPGHVIERGKPA